MAITVANALECGHAETSLSKVNNMYNVHVLYAGTIQWALQITAVYKTQIVVDKNFKL
jgi:hypothetical protein